MSPTESNTTLSKHKAQPRWQSQALERDDCFSSAFEFAAIGMTLVSPEGRFMQVNQALCQLLGYTAPELLNLTFQDLTHPDDLEADLAFVVQMLRGELNTYQMEKRYFHKNGATIWVLLSVSLIRDATGAPEFFISQIQDMTALKQSEEHRQKLLEKLYQARKEEGVQRIVEAIAGEFEHILQQVTNNLEAVVAGGALNNPIRPQLDEALKSARRGTDLSRLMRSCIGQRTEKRGFLDLSYTCRAVLANISTSLLQILKTDFPHQGPLVQADGEQIQEVLHNLLNNAAEATAGGRGTITLTLSSLPANTLKNYTLQPMDWQPAADQYAILTVADTGPGISPEHMEQIFDPFFTDKVPGRGLGLPVALGIIKAHDGALAIESQPHQGTRVHIFLPVTDKEGFTTKPF